MRIDAVAIIGIIHADANDTAIALTLPAGITRYQVMGIQIAHASISLTTAQAGVYTAAAAGGVAVASHQALSTVTASAADTNGNGMALTQTLPAATWFTETVLYFNVGTAQGAPATCDVVIQIASLS